MAKYDLDIGIIGGGAAGLTVAAGAARLGARTLLIEKETSLGGDCLHFGCVPSKTLIRTAHIRHQMNRAEEFGLPAVTADPVDFSRVSERIRSVIAEIQEHDSVERFCRLGVQVRFGQAEFIDEYSLRLDGETISARAWVIATGSSPAPPGLEALSNIDYITNKEIFSLDRLPETMLVLGAGPIAVEMAQAFRRLGSRVTIIQRSGQILSREDRDMADTVMAALRREGVEILLNTTVENATEDNGIKTVTVRDADGNRKDLTADTVLLAQGRTPNTGALGLDRLDIAMTPRGITVDNRLRTSQSHIYAPGDVNGAFQFTHAAGYEGGIVITNAVFRLPRKADYTHMPWCTYTDPELASIGMNEKAARAAGIDYAVWSEEFNNNDRALAEGNTCGRIKLIVNEREKVIGVQLVGPRAGDLLGEWVAVVNGGVKLSTLAGAIHPYPTLTEINKRVAGNLLATKIFSDRVKKGLKLFFQLKGPVREPCSTIKTPMED